jgi:uncharacterized membrane protein
MYRLGYGAALALGAALMYAFDPRAGARRRARVRDEVDHLVHAAARGGQKAETDAAQRLHGLGARLRSSAAGAAGAKADDRILVERVRTRLGHYCSHPHAVAVVACEGTVELRGPILADEAGDVINHARLVPGVLRVVDALERHTSPEGIPALQGSRARPRHGLGRTRWPPSIRLGMGTAGAALALAGLRRGGPAGAALTTLGAATLVRAAANRPLDALVGVRDGARGGIDVTKTVRVDAPVDVVFDYFAAFENFPRFMRHVRDVSRVDDKRFHWKVEGPGGIAFEWDGVLTDWVPQKRVAWTSTEDAMVHNRGEARFEAVGDKSTRLTIRLVYRPPMGAVGHAAARLLGADPKHELDDDLLRFKSLIEAGKATGRHGPVTREEVPPTRT